VNTGTAACSFAPVWRREARSVAPIAERDRLFDCCRAPATRRAARGRRVAAAEAPANAASSAFAAKTGAPMARQGTAAVGVDGCEGMPGGAMARLLALVRLGRLTPQRGSGRCTWSAESSSPGERGQRRPPKAWRNLRAARQNQKPARRLASAAQDQPHAHPARQHPKMRCYERRLGRRQR